MSRFKTYFFKFYWSDVQGLPTIIDQLQINGHHCSLCTITDVPSIAASTPANPNTWLTYAVSGVHWICLPNLCHTNWELWVIFLKTSPGAIWRPKSGISSKWNVMRFVRGVTIDNNVLSHVIIWLIYMTGVVCQTFVLFRSELCAYVKQIYITQPQIHCTDWDF